MSFFEKINSLELHVLNYDGIRKVIILPERYDLVTAMSMAESRVMNGAYAYAGMFVNGRCYCEYEA